MGTEDPAEGEGAHPVTMSGCDREAGESHAGGGGTAEDRGTGQRVELGGKASSLYLQCWACSSNSINVERMNGLVLASLLADRGLTQLGFLSSWFGTPFLIGSEVAGDKVPAR